MVKRFALTLVSLLALVGCTPNLDKPAPSPSPKPSASETKLGLTFQDVNLMRARLQALNLITCTKFTVIENATNALQHAQCDDDIVFSIYKDKDQGIKSSGDLGETIVIEGLADQAVFLVGANWGINCGDDRGLCDVIQVSLGGQVLVIKK